MPTGLWLGNMKEKDHLEDRGVDGSTVFRRILKKQNEGRGMDCSGCGQGKMAGTCECGDEPSGYIKCGEFLG
jgi:hypothetical protein